MGPRSHHLALTALALLSLLLTAMAPAGRRPRHTLSAASDPNLTLDKTAQAVSGCRRYEATLTITGAPPPRSTDTILVIDASTYMGYGSPSSLTYAKQAATDLATRILADRDSRVAVVSYNEAATLRVQLTADLATVKDRIGEIGASSGSNMKAGLDRAASHMGSSGRTGVARAIVLLSGTVANRPNEWCQDWPVQPTECTIAGYQAGQAAQGQATVYAAGFLGYIHSAHPASEGVARDTLQLAQNGGYYETLSSLGTEGLYNAIVRPGTQAATNAVVSEELAAGFELVPGSLNASRGTATASGGAITWTIGAIGRETLTLRYQVTARPGYAGALPLSTATTLSYTSAGGEAGQTLAFPNPAIAVPGDLTAAAGADRTIPLGGSVILGNEPAAAGGTGPYTYRWQPAEGLDDPEAANPQASPAETTTYWLTVTDAAGCTASDSVLVSVLSHPAPVAGDDSATTCRNAPVTIEVLANDQAAQGALDPASVTVTAGPSHGTAAPDAQGAIRYTPAAGYTGPDSLQYTVKDDQGYASNPATVSVTVHEGPAASIERSYDPCAGRVTLRAAVSGGAPPYAYLWTSGSQTLGEGDTCILAGYGAEGTVDLQVTDSRGCVTTASTGYAINPELGVELASAMACTGRVTLTAWGRGGSGAYTYAWEAGDDDLYDEGTGPTFTVQGYNTAGTVRVRVSDGACTATAAQDYRIAPELGVEIEQVTACSGSVTFKATASGGDGSYSYAWDVDGDGFDDGTGPTLALGGYGASGTVQVRATDGQGCTATAGSGYGINPQLSVSLELAYDHCAGRVTFTAAGTGGDGAYEYAWDTDGDGFDDGTGALLALSGYGAAGDVRVRVTDGEGCTAEAGAPYSIAGRLDLSVEPGTGDGCTGTACFSGRASGGDGPYSYRWDLDGDGAYDDAAGPEVCTALPADGAYTVRAEVTDGRGCTASAAQTVTVSVPAPHLTLSKAAEQPLVRRGATVRYSYGVTNTGSCPLLQVSLDDSELGAIALSGLTDEDGDGAADDLAAGAGAWGEASTVVLADAFGTATARGENARGVAAVAQAGAGVSVIEPCLRLQVLGPAVAYEGEEIAYEYTLTNCSDDAALSGVTLSEPQEGRALWGPEDLQPGEAVSVTVRSRVPWGGPSPSVSKATARGLDALGMEVVAEAQHALAILRPLGYVFWDRAGDGRRDPGDPLLGGWCIRLLKADNYVTYEAVTVQNEGSAYHGRWLPPRNLPAGDYWVFEVERPGWVETYPAGNGGVYSIRYHGDGTYDLLNTRPQGFDGLCFGNAEGAPGSGGTETPTPTGTATVEPSVTPTGTPTATPAATVTVTPSATPRPVGRRLNLPLVCGGAR